MLTDEQAYVVGLLRRGLAGASVQEMPAAAAGLDARLVADAIRRNGILLMAYGSLGDLPEAQSLLQAEYYASVSQAVNQGHEGRRILCALAEAGLGCMPIKGWEMRTLYPQPAMRQMADLDVLVRPYDYARVERVMLALGYEATSGETSWKHDNFAKDAVTVEVHKRLTDDSDAVREWEGRMWGRREPAESVYGNVWRMSAEDQYVFHFVHMRKDLLNGSLGLRRIVDAWLLDQHSDERDADIVGRELEATGIAQFCERMRHLARACMGEEQMDEGAELLLRHAFTCGIYGNGRSYKAGRIARMSHGGISGGKFRSIVAAVFLPVGRMKAQYPELERWPVLLPVCWARRIASYLLDGNLKQYRAQLDYSDVTEADIAEMRRVFEASGLS